MEYLIHYGKKRRSGRYPWGSGKRPFQSAKESLARRRTPEARTSRINKRASKKMSKIETRRLSRQKEADKYFQKAQKKSTSFFSSQSGVNKDLNRASNIQRDVNKLEYKGKKYYQKTLKKLDKLGKLSDIDPDLKKLGDGYIKRVELNSKSIYNNLIIGRGTIIYKR